MIAHNKQLITANPLLKIVALIFGYLFWLVLAFHQHVETSINIPISFYQSENKFSVNAPTSLSIKTAGKRRDMQKLNFDQLAAHIDISNMKTIGSYQIPILPEHIFLPHQVKLLHYTPALINIKLT